MVIPPEVEGQPVNAVAKGVQLTIDYPDGRGSAARLLEASETEMLLELDDIRWRLTPRTRDEPPIALQTPGLRRWEWIIRSEQPSGE